MFVMEFCDVGQLNSHSQCFAFPSRFMLDQRCPTRERFATDSTAKLLQVLPVQMAYQSLLQLIFLEANFAFERLFRFILKVIELHVLVDLDLGPIRGRAEIAGKQIRRKNFALIDAVNSFQMQFQIVFPSERHLVRANIALMSHRLQSMT